MLYDGLGVELWDAQTDLQGLKEIPSLLGSGRGCEAGRSRGRDGTEA